VKLITFLTTLAVTTFPLLAAADHVPEPPTIRVTGEAIVREKPDQAEIEVGVTTQAKRAPDATAENAKRVEAVLAAVKKVLGDEGEIQTAGYNLSPNQEWPKEGGSPKIVGYTASNVVRARTTDLDKVGPVIDAALEAGANQVQGLNFSLRDEAKARDRALALAAKRAKAKAEALADALGVKLGAVRSADEAAAAPPPMPYGRVAMAAMKAEGAPTQIEAGSLDVTATVTLAIEIAK
jgi:uncharacterized protein